MDKSYLAGFFDGEGSVTIGRGGLGTSFTCSITISQRDKNILDKISEFLLSNGINSKIYSKEYTTKKGIHLISGLVIHKQSDALKFLTMVKNYVIVKKEQVELGIIFLNYIKNKKDIAHGKHCHFLSFDDKKTLLALGDKVKSLNSDKGRRPNTKKKIAKELIQYRKEHNFFLPMEYQV